MMKLYSYLVVLLLLLSCGAAKPGKESVMKDGNNKGQADFEVLIESQIGGFQTPQIRVAKEPVGVQEIYAQINKTRKPGFEIPKVDFTKEAIVGIFMGEKNTGGFNVTVEKIKEDKDKVTVYVKETEPEASDMVTMVITQPFCVVKLKNYGKAIHFEKVKK